MAANEELTSGSCTNPSHLHDIIFAKGCNSWSYIKLTHSDSQPVVFSFCGYAFIRIPEQVALGSVLPGLDGIPACQGE